MGFLDKLLGRSKKAVDTAEEKLHVHDHDHDHGEAAQAPTPPAAPAPAAPETGAAPEGETGGTA